MHGNDTHHPTPTRRLFLGCAVGGLGIGAAPIPKDPEEVIPLRSIFATSGQKELAEISFKNALSGDEGKQRRFFGSPLGPSNLFLVFGDNIDAAIEATYSAFVYGRSVDRPVLRPGVSQGEHDGLWAFVLFGCAQTSPTEWKVTRVSLQRNYVRFRIVRPDPKKEKFYQFDRCSYMCWAPLGKTQRKGDYPRSLRRNKLRADHDTPRTRGRFLGRILVRPPNI
jgi:hypothetical protein